jgi:hypothetical protein
VQHLLRLAVRNVGFTPVLTLLVVVFFGQSVLRRALSGDPLEALGHLRIGLPLEPI